MTKTYCDLCGKVMKPSERKGYKIYYDWPLDIDLCEDCEEKWMEFKEKNADKYNKLYDELHSQEMREVRQFLGIEEASDVNESSEEGLC